MSDRLRAVGRFSGVEELEDGSAESYSATRNLQLLVSADGPLEHRFGLVTLGVVGLEHPSG
jgi:hypothetical protein